MFQKKRGTRFSEENLGRVLFSLSILFIFLLSLLLTSSPAIKYRSWDVDYSWSHWIGFLLWTACTFFAYKTANKNLRNWDKTLFFTIQLLCGWGLITIWRIYPFYGLKQTIWYLIASIVGIFIIRNPSILEQLRTRKYFWMTIGYILIILTFFLGTYPGGDGPRLWLGTRGLYFQPSEFLKIIFIIYLSSYFAEYPSGKFDFNRTILPTLIFIISLLGLLIGQRDLGTALIFTALYILMLYFAFGKKRILLVGGLVAIIFALLG